MINGLMEWSRNIVCFSIFAVLIKNLLPGEKYAPYVKLYMGFMMLLVFFTPILKVLEADRTLQYLTEILGGVQEIKEDSFLASINENSNYKRQKGEYTKMLEQSVVDYLTDSLKGQAEWQGYQVERAAVQWEEKEESETFGTITGMTVYLRKEGESGTEGEVKIEPIFIEVFSELEDKEEMEGEESRQLKHLLSQCYHLKEEEIAVQIAE